MLDGLLKAARTLEPPCSPTQRMVFRCKSLIPCKYFPIVPGRGMIYTIIWLFAFCFGAWCLVLFQTRTLPT